MPLITQQTNTYIFHTFFYCFYCYFEQVNVTWQLGFRFYQKNSYKKTRVKTIKVQIISVHVSVKLKKRSLVLFTLLQDYDPT